MAEILRLRPHYSYSVSSTTRPPRGYEVDGQDYHFISEDAFRAKISNGDFLEYAEVHTFLYGTDKLRLSEHLKNGDYLLLDLDVHGGNAVLKLYPKHTIAIFIDPPSIEELRRRLKLRGSESDEEIEQRLSRYPMEQKLSESYPFRVINDNLEQAVEEIVTIIDNHKLSQSSRKTKSMVENHELHSEGGLSEFEDTVDITVEQEEGLSDDLVIESEEPVLADAEETSEPVVPAELLQPSLVDDFHGIAESVYEAVMIAAQRARQIGRKQKKEIDAWTRSLDSISSLDPDEDSPDQGVDHFHHPKPTVKALIELKNNQIDYHYPKENS